MVPPQSATHFVSHSLTNNLCVAGHASNPACTHTLNGFLTVLALCHIVLMSTDPKMGALEYKVQSPDKTMLFSEDNEKGSQIENYCLLNILEFTSARKRMSVVVRKMDNNDGRVFLLKEGRSGEGEEREETERHLGKFASEGLKMLTLVYKVVPEEEYEE
ncbi:hypothetical protein H2248_005407 [Termitomyces sp. 'cryptogamus']|nr:hypothetical protein H2248_005407 [Termitomyces sp. 'cryptogamus']